MKKTFHITSVHPRYDIRIFYKECVSLSKAGYETTLLVADGKGDVQGDEIKIIDFGMPLNRFHRMTVIVWRMIKFCWNKQVGIFHIHDPELLFLALILTLQGKTVIFDVHEDVQAQIKNKEYISSVVKPIIAFTYRMFEISISRYISGVITATPYIREKFSEYSKNSVLICNFPILDEFKNMNRSLKTKEPNICCYIGAITKGRCAIELVEAAQMVQSDIRIVFMGGVESEDLKNRMEELDVKKRISFEPYGSRLEVKKLMEKSTIGLCVMKPHNNHVDSLPNKLFEYMSAGLCSIVSNFELWEDLIRITGSGVSCDPMSPEDIAKKIDLLLSDPDASEKMGQNGLKSVKSFYNWNAEEKKLIEFYDSLYPEKSR